MRGLSAWCAALAAACLSYAAAAAPLPAPGPAAAHASAQIHTEALRYAQTILPIIDTVEEYYIRPVSRAQLAEAALTGLYEAVRQPVPATLRLDLQRAGHGEMYGLLVRTRESLGDHEALRDGRSVLVSLRALPRVLDQYSGLAGPQEFNYLDLNEATPWAATGLEFVGIAVPSLRLADPGVILLPGDGALHDRVVQPTGPVRIQTVIPGSPAQKAGVRPGDLIVKIDGRRPESPTFATLFRRLLPVQPGMPMNPQSPQASAAHLTLLRGGRSEPLEVTVAPAVFRPETVFGTRRRADGSWDFLLDPADRLGYVRLGAIGRQSHTEFRDALRSLRSHGVQGLVLDLRWCPGGYLYEAATITRLFLSESVPVGSQRIKDKPVEFIRHESLDPPYLEFPIVVLVNGETSGGGEMIAAALQDHHRAVIAGQRTVGKGTIQITPTRLERLGFKVTQGILIRPSGKNLQRYPESLPSDDWGVRPDAGHDIPLTPESSRQLKQWWIEYVLRPAGSSEALPLDDPENDPQRQAAVQMLRDLLKKP